MERVRAAHLSVLIEVRALLLVVHHTVGKVRVEEEDAVARDADELGRRLALDRAYRRPEPTKTCS